MYLQVLSICLRKGQTRVVSSADAGTASRPTGTDGSPTLSTNASVLRQSPKQCPHIPKDTAMAVVGAALSNAPKLRTRASGTFTPAGLTTPAPSAAIKTPATTMPHTAPPHTTPRPIPVYGSMATSASASAITPSTFEVFVAKDTFKFNAAHFVAFEGYRERLHGHNYTVSVRLQGSHTYIGPDGYVIDYGNIKKVCKDICKELNEHFLCPSYSDVLKITHHSNNQMVRIDCPMDGTHFEFPTDDCKFLPIVHATTEELAIYLWSVVMERLDANFLLQRGIGSMELTVAEAPGQQATFRYPVQATKLDVRNFIQSGPIVPTPCLDKPKSAKTNPSCGPNCPDAHPAAAPAAAATTSENATDTNAATNNDSTKAAKHTVSPEVLLSLTNAMKAQGLLSPDVSEEQLSTAVKNVVAQL